MIDSGKLYPRRGEAIAVLLFTFIAFASVSLLGERALGKVQILLGEVFILVPAYLYARWRHYRLSLIFRLRPISLRVAWVSVIIGLAMTVIADELDRLMNLLLPFPEEFARLLRQLLTANTLMEWVIVLLGAVMLAGLFEEMLFRGFLQNALEQHYEDVRRAILWTALGFAIIHFNPWWIVQIILLGVFLGIMAWKSNSVLPGAIVHAINNAISVVVINAEGYHSDMLLWRGHIHPLLLLAAIAALALGLRLFYQYCEEETEIPTLLNTPPS